MTANLQAGGVTYSVVGDIVLRREEASYGGGCSYSRLSVDDMVNEVRSLPNGNGVNMTAVSFSIIDGVVTRREEEGFKVRETIVSFAEMENELNFAREEKLPGNVAIASMPMKELAVETPTGLCRLPGKHIFRVDGGSLFIYPDANSEATMAFAPGEWLTVERVFEDAESMAGALEGCRTPQAVVRDLNAPGYAGEPIHY